jgi:hypothetical protein
LRRRVQRWQRITSWLKRMSGLDGIWPELAEGRPGLAPGRPEPMGEPVFGLGMELIPDCKAVSETQRNMIFAFSCPLKGSGTIAK